MREQPQGISYYWIVISYREIKPYAVLDEYIKCIWMLENDTCSGETEFIFPDGSPELVFHYGDPFKRILDNGKAVVQERTMLVGQITSRIDLQATGRTGVIGVRFYPWAAQYFLPVPLHELTNIDMSLHHIFGSAACHLEEQLVNSSANDAVKLIQQFLHAQLGVSRYEQHTMKKVVNHIVSQQGNVRIEQLASDSNLSMRQFNRRFTTHIGIAPKHFTGIVRFQHFFELTRQYPASGLSSLAHASGYYDQSHFIREFRNYTRLSPKEYFRNEDQLATLFLPV